ncbi:adenosine deaminase [Paenibacillus chartarius]|uniref:adenosine deaminase n=1 Tax=Paenibacillus chartarius TaxID=747481 RepID=A0ABV6DQP6_9BACL
MDHVRLLPKVDLHIHLDGSMRPATVIELAAEEGIRLPDTDPARLAAHLQASEMCGSLGDYLAKFDLPLRCLQTSEGLRRAAYELVMDAHADRVKYIEVRFAPLLHTAGRLSAEEVIAEVLHGLERGERESGTLARAIVICLRSHDPAENIRVIHAAHSFQGRGVVGVDLAGDEARFPPQLHRDVFRLADRYGFPVTLHAGEAAGAENIRECVSHMHAVRIGHGVRLKESEPLVQWIKERNIALEMCVTSNIQTKAVRCWEEHPIKEYFEQGILVTVNTDNTTVSNTTMTQEYEKIMKLYRFTIGEMKQLILNAANVSFLETERKRELTASLQTELGLASGT